MLKTITSILFNSVSILIFAQSGWKELNIDKFQLKPDHYSTVGIDDGLRPRLNMDGSFTIPGLNTNYLFDSEGDYKGETPQEIAAFVDSSIKVVLTDPPVFSRKGNVVGYIDHFKLFYSISGKVHAVELEKVISYNHKGEEYEKGLNADSRQIISITDKEIVFYQHYFRMSEQTHPGIKPVRGIPYSFMRIGCCNLETGKVTFNYLFVDQFEKHKDLSVGDHPVKKVHFLGMKNGHALFGFTNYTTIDFYVKTGLAQEAIKVPEQIDGYYSISAVDLKSFEEKELTAEGIKKPAEAFALYFFPANDGFFLSWSKKYDKTIFEAHMDLIEVEENLSVSRTSVLLPVEDLPLKSGMPIYPQKVKNLDGSEWYAMNARFSNSKKRQDLKDQDPVIIMVNKEGEIQYRDNSILEWSLFSDAMDDANEKESCLPCLADLNKEDFKFVKEDPDSREITELTQKGNYGKSNNTFFIRNGNSINYVQVFVIYKVPLKAGEPIRTNAYVRTGIIWLK